MATQKTKQEKLLTYLKKNGKISDLQARSLFGMQNLRARICELRQNGWRITSEKKRNDNRSVMYKVTKHPA